MKNNKNKNEKKSGKESDEHNTSVGMAQGDISALKKFKNLIYTEFWL